MDERKLLTIWINHYPDKIEICFRPGEVMFALDTSGDQWNANFLLDNTLNASLELAYHHEAAGLYIIETQVDGTVIEREMLQ